MPALGQGTWNMGESKSARKDEVAALQLGLDLGMSLIDTAEMYGDGGAEEVVGEAIAGRRDAVFLVSKVYPHNATRDGVRQACERSLRRLHTDRLDLYLLHWRGNVPLAETLDGLLALQREGKILEFGVSNFDRDDLIEAAALPGADGVFAAGIVSRRNVQPAAQCGAGQRRREPWRDPGAGGGGVAAASAECRGHSKSGAAGTCGTEPGRHDHPAGGRRLARTGRGLCAAAPGHATGDALMKLWVSTCLLALAAGAQAAPADLVAGKAAFQRCAECHAVGPGASAGFAPQLNGIVGRAAGSTGDFAYSPVLKHARFHWTEQNLAGFLRAPSAFLPGTKMSFWGISDYQEIVNVIGYLKTFGPPPPAGRQP
jgi:cytochrome c2